MNRCLYVGNLPHECTEDELRHLFESEGLGADTVKIVTDHKTGRPRGFGFVSLKNEEDMATALESIGGKELSGRPLKVGAARKENREIGRPSAPEYAYGGRPGGNRRRGSR